MKPSKRLQEDSVLTQDTVQVPTLALTDEESLQQSQIQVKLNQAWQQRNQPYPEFGNLTYLQKFENNRNKAHTILPKKVNEEDVIVGSGTLEQKLEAVLSAVNILDLSAEVKAFDKNKNKVVLALALILSQLFQALIVLQLVQALNFFQPDWLSHQS